MALSRVRSDVPDRSRRPLLSVLQADLPAVLRHQAERSVAGETRFRKGVQRMPGSRVEGDMTGQDPRAALQHMCETNAALQDSGGDVWQWMPVSMGGTPSWPSVANVTAKPAS